jgi:hypothetical protein
VTELTRVLPFRKLPCANMLANGYEAVIVIYSPGLDPSEQVGGVLPHDQLGTQHLIEALLPLFRTTLILFAGRPRLDADWTIAVVFCSSVVAERFACAARKAYSAPAETAAVSLLR